MKILRLIVGFILLFLNYSIQGQNINAVNSNFNLLLVGIKNDIIIYSDSIDCENIITKLIGPVNDEIYTGCEFSITPKKMGMIAFLVYNVQKDDTFLLYRINYLVREIPNPIPYLMGIGNKDKYISKNRLVQSQNINVNYPSDFILSSTLKRFLVSSYRFTIIKKKTKTETTFLSKSYRLTKEIRNELKKVEDGDIIFISNIVAKGPNGIIRELEDIRLEIKD